MGTDFNSSSRAIYLQIADAICDSVLKGEFRADERIPSVREYAAEVSVNVNTVMRSYDYLSGLGIIYNKRGLGYFASADCVPLVRKLRRSELQQESLPAIFRQLNALGVTADELARLYSDFINSINSKQN